MCEPDMCVHFSPDSKSENLSSTGGTGKGIDKLSSAMLRRIFISRLTLALAATCAFAQPKKKRILAIGQLKGFQHDSVSDGLAAIYNLGKETGLWETYIRTDTQWITKKKGEANRPFIEGIDGRMRADEFRQVARCREVAIFNNDRGLELIPRMAIERPTTPCKLST